MFLGRRFLIVLIVIMLIFAVAVHAEKGVSQPDLPESVYPVSVYFAPDDNYLLTDDVGEELA